MNFCQSWTTLHTCLVVGTLFMLAGYVFNWFIFARINRRKETKNMICSYLRGYGEMSAASLINCLTESGFRMYGSQSKFFALMASLERDKLVTHRDEWHEFEDWPALGTMHYAVRYYQLLQSALGH